MEKVLQDFIDLIEKKSGMQITDIHFPQFKKYILEQSEKYSISIEKFLDKIQTDAVELEKLLNAVVVNETYFFREETQFSFLEKFIKQNYSGKNIVFWSAASSSGEEAYSLASLSLEVGANPIVYASDIDTEAVDDVKKGIYKDNSFRFDGEKYKKLIEKYISSTTKVKGQNYFYLNDFLKSKVLPYRINLLNLENSIIQDNSVDVIFVRNVFIYFDSKTRLQILKNLTKKLKTNGLLFVSISEVGGIDLSNSDIMLEKINENSVFYFQKIAEKKEKNEKKETNEKNSLIQNTNSSKSEFLSSLRQNLHTKKIENDLPQKKVDDSIQENLEPKEVFIKIKEFTKEKKFDDAVEFLEKHFSQLKFIHYKLFFLGFINLEKGDIPKAIDFYEKAGFSKTDFWPAHFLIATNTNEIKKKKSEFTKTALILENEKNDKEEYSFLMGEFSSDYFYKICNEVLAKGEIK